jgi:hypothetical protein
MPRSPGRWPGVSVTLKIFFFSVSCWCGARWAHRLLPVLQAGLLPGASAGGVRSMARWHEFSWRHVRGRCGCRIWFAFSRKRPLLQVADFVAPCVPTGLACGRVGNFINGELWGRLASPSLAVGHGVSGGGVTCHATRRSSTSSCSRACCCLCLLWLYARKPRRPGQVAAAFPVGLRRVSLRCGVFSRARRPSGFAQYGLEHGAMAVHSDGGRRRRSLVVGRPTSHSSR